MSGINKVILVGRMGKDPEVKHTRDGKEFSTFSMATSKKIKDEEKTTWHNIVVWNEHTAKYINDFAQKGTLVYIEGEIDNRKYEKQDGSTGYASDVVVGAFSGNAQILADGVPREGGGRRDRDDDEREEKPKPERRTRTKPKEKSYREESGGEAERHNWEKDLDDEIPF
jgi:single-strand DNA-binding protein